MGDVLIWTAKTPLGIVAIVLAVGCIIGYLFARQAASSVRLGLLIGVLIGVAVFAYRANDAKNERYPHLRRQQSMVEPVPKPEIFQAAIVLDRHAITR